MSACADNSFRIALLVRGELDSSEEALLRAHLAGCATCASELAAEEQLSRKLEKLPRLMAPADLKAQVQDRMRERVGRARVLRMTPRRLFVAGMIALALVIGAAVTLRSRSAGDPLALAARQAVAERRGLDLQRDLFPSETAGAPALLRELAQRYGLPATTAFPGDAELRLVSVRPGTALGRFPRSSSIWTRRRAWSRSRSCPETRCRSRRTGPARYSSSARFWRASSSAAWCSGRWGGRFMCLRHRWTTRSWHDYS